MIKKISILILLIIIGVGAYITYRYKYHVSTQQEEFKASAQESVKTSKEEDKNTIGLCDLIKSNSLKGIVFNTLFPKDNTTTFAYMSKNCEITSIGTVDLGFSRDSWFYQKHNHIDSEIELSTPTAKISDSKRKLIFHGNDGNVVEYELPLEVQNSLPTGLQAHESKADTELKYEYSTSPDGNLLILPRKGMPGVIMIYDLYKRTSGELPVQEELVKNTPELSVSNFAWSTDSKNIIVLYNAYTPKSTLQAELINTTSFERKQLFTFKPEYRPGRYDYFTVWAQLADGTMLIQSAGRGVQTLQYNGESITSRKQITDKTVKLIKLIYE